MLTATCPSAGREVKLQSKNPQFNFAWTEKYCNTKSVFWVLKCSVTMNMYSGFSNIYYFYYINAYLNNYKL